MINFLDIAFGLMAIPTILSTILLAPRVNWAARPANSGIAKPGPDGLDLPTLRYFLVRRSERSPAEEESFIFPHPSSGAPRAPALPPFPKDGLGQRTGVGKAVAGLPVLHDSVQPAMKWFRFSIRS